LANSCSYEMYHLPAPTTPVTLPRLACLDSPPPDDIKETAARIAERRIIRAGVDAWQAIGKAESFEAWKAIGTALAVGKHHALRVTGANAAWGRNYGREFSGWIQKHGFGAMPKSTRSWAIALHENAKAIERWRQDLPERQRKRLVNPQSVVKRWQREMQHGNSKCPQDLKRDALAGWRRFVACVSALPAHEAAPLLQAALAEAASMAHV
jgi:hypothetical protein